MEIRSIKDSEVLELKINHVLGCFTDYLYHKHVSDQIQEELDSISSELDSGAPSTGIIKVSKDCKNNLSPWQNELFARESDLIAEQDKHVSAMLKVDMWVGSIKNDLHRKIVVEYLINHRGENTESVAEKFFTTKGNVCKIAQRITTNIARKIS